MRSRSKYFDSKNPADLQCFFRSCSSSSRFVFAQGMTSFFVLFRLSMNCMVVGIPSDSQRGVQLSLTSFWKLLSLSQIELNLKGVADFFGLVSR
jgi:hypothetical protein